MRSSLLDHPKVVRISRELQKHREFRDWLTPGGGGPMNGQTCSDSALRCVTTALLMRCWSIAREHGKFVGDDLVLEHSEVADIDQMAGAPGVGVAMKSVGWVVSQNGVTLPNFKEFNVPMTNAEKQREYRKRNANSNEAVTESLPTEGNEKRENVTSRVEKRREITTTPLPTSGAFERFWTAWPSSSRKASKGKCEQLWAKGSFESQAELILAHVEAMKLSGDWRKDVGAYIPSPLVYLGQRRWEGADTTGAFARNETGAVI